MKVIRLEITAEQGAINTLYPVFSLENKETGKYYYEGIEYEPKLQMIKKLQRNYVMFLSKYWNELKVQYFLKKLYT
jgi:hypothetical protein